MLKYALTESAKGQMFTKTGRKDKERTHRRKTAIPFSPQKVFEAGEPDTLDGSAIS